MNRIHFLFFAALTSISLQAQEPDWQTVTINQGQASLSMPGKPVETTQNNSSLVGDVTSNIYTVDVPDDGSVSIDCTNLPGVALIFAGNDTIYDNAKGSFLSNIHGKTDSWQPTTRNGNSGMKLMFSTPPLKENHPGYDGEAEFYIVNGALYVISVMDQVGASLNMEDKVFSSLQFTSGSSN